MAIDDAVDLGGESPDDVNANGVIPDGLANDGPTGGRLGWVRPSRPRGGTALLVRENAGELAGISEFLANRAERDDKPGFKALWTSEDAILASKLGTAAQRTRWELEGNKPRWSRSDWDEMVINPSFPGRWAYLYRLTEKRLRKQYAPAGSTGTAQYSILVWQVAALDTEIAMLQSRKPEERDRRTLNQLRERMLEYVAQLQKYTESEKREYTVRSEVIAKTLAVVIGVAEASIDDPAARSAFLKQLSGAVTGQSLAIAAPADVVDVKKADK